MNQDNNVFTENAISNSTQRALQSNNNDENKEEYKILLSTENPISQINKKNSRIIYYCLFNKTYTIIDKYSIEEILIQLKKFQVDNFFIIQIDNDQKLHSEIIKLHFKSEIEDISKMFNLKLDYCFTPIDGLLYFNLSVIENIYIDEVDNFLIQIFIYKNGIYIINKQSCNLIQKIFIDKFNFTELNNKVFFQRAYKAKEKNYNKINDFNIKFMIQNQNKQIKSSPIRKRSLSFTSKKPVQKKLSCKELGFHNKSLSRKKKKNKNSKEKKVHYQKEDKIDSDDEESFITRKLDYNNLEGSLKLALQTEYNNVGITNTTNLTIKDPYFRDNDEFDRNLGFECKKKKSIHSLNNTIETIVSDQSKSTESKQISNFSTDDLIYWLLISSLTKLEEYSNSLILEANSLREIYLELSENERNDFFRRIHSVEISMQIVYQEILNKKKFLKFAKQQFKNYNKLTNNFYFKKSFNFFLELMISKVMQLEITLEKLQNMVRMIKENYSIIIEDNTEKQNIKLNMVMKVLAIITAIYAPFNIIPSIWGMNITIPFQEDKTLWPFFGIVFFLIFLFFGQLVLFKKLNWF